MRHLSHHLQPSDERLSFKEIMVTQARAHSAVALWLLEIGALTLLGFNIYMFIFHPDGRLVALPQIFVFGLGAVWFARMLVLRQRAGGGAPGPSPS